MNFYTVLEAQAIMVLLHHFLRAIPSRLRIVRNSDQSEMSLDHLREHAAVGFIHARQGGVIRWDSALPICGIVDGYLDLPAEVVDSIWETSTAFVSADELRATLRGAVEKLRAATHAAIALENS